MADGSPRRSIAGPLVLAVIFLAVIGAGAGFSLGTLNRHTQPTSQSSSNSGGTGTDGTPATTGPSATPASAPASGKRCLAHTEQQAHVSPLYQVFYLRTQLSEVWICKSGDGTLFYQGHKIVNGLDEDLVEGVNALYLPTVEPEADNGWVATNTDPANGNVTKYHVKPHKLIIEYVWKGTQDEQDAV